MIRMCITTIALLASILSAFIPEMHCSMLSGDDIAQDVRKDQNILQVHHSLGHSWRIELSREWDILGPFPIHAREQHFLSPSFPLDLSKSYHHDLLGTWPSSYANSAQVTWTKATADEDGNLAVSFPNVRWERLRKTEGWAALQHHAILRTTLTVHPPEPVSGNPPPRLYVELKQGSYFALISRSYEGEGNKRAIESHNITPEWHTGNIYDLHRAPRSTIDLPGNVSLDRPSVYDLFVCGDYEIRLFGDPEDRGEEIPTLLVKLQVDILRQIDFSRHADHDIVPTFVDGYAFGNAVGVGLQFYTGWWKVIGVKIDTKLAECIKLSLPREVAFAPSQTRIVAIQLAQLCAIEEELLGFSLTVIPLDPSKERRQLVLPVQINLKHLPFWASDTPSQEPIEVTYFSATSHPTAFLVKAPFNVPEKDTSPILALHGAGVDVIKYRFWADSLQRQEKSWIIMPTGRTEWGLDWHGPSASEAFASLHALAEVLNARHPSWSFDPTTKVTLVGHSNGGQGVWYLASRYPDRVRAAVAAAGYLKSQAYIPLTQSRAGHYVDPSLRAVLESSLTPDDNDLFMSNVARKPILAIHGGSDTNVPTWHSREYYSVVNTWGDGLNITFKEDEGKPHWYPEVLDNSEVQKFFDDHLNTAGPPQDVGAFTLTVANPVHSGPLYGWAITEVMIPGRLARLSVSVVGNTTYLRTTNVQVVYCTAHAVGSQNTIIINSNFKSMPTRLGADDVLTFRKERTWTVSTSNISPALPPPRDRIQNILDTPALITIVIPEHIEKHSRAFSAALRIAHILNVYHKLDTEIITDKTASSLFFPKTSTSAAAAQAGAPRGNSVIIGGPENRFGLHLLARNQTEFQLEGLGSNESEGVYVWTIRGHRFKEPGLGVVFTHPHPTRPDGLALFLAGTDDEGLERALRLFPFRTGVPVPDWVVIGREADKVGAAGVVGAGVWNNEWKWNEAMSWLP